MISHLKYFIVILFATANIFAQTTVMIPMRDGVHLATNIYLPPDTVNSPVPVVLNRTPYGRGPAGAYMDSLLSHGIGFVSQDTRGRGGSEGKADIFLVDGWGEKQDGYDTVEWLAQQSWCNGKIGIFGGSAHGITGYLCAGAAPPHLVCAFVANCASDMYHHAIFPGGCYRKEQVDGWTFFQGLTDLKQVLTSHYLYSSFWDSLSILTRIDFISIPIFHVAGWYDTFCEGNVDAFRELQNNGAPGAFGNQKIIMGPWTHGNWNQRKQGELFYPENSLWNADSVALLWFRYYLNDEPNEIQSIAPVQCYIMGAVSGGQSESGNEWRYFDSWPPENISTDTLFLHPDKSLQDVVPVKNDTALQYYHDPHAPLFCNGGRNLIWGSGPKNQLWQDISAQNVVWTTEPLADEWIITGRVKAKIFLESDCIDTDVMVRLEDVYPNGKSYLVLDGAKKVRFRNGFDHEDFMTPGEIYEIIVDLGNIAYSFAPGHKIRVAVSSALFPRYDKNSNTGNPPFQDNPFKIAHNKIYCDAQHSSCIILPTLQEETQIVARTSMTNPKSFEILQNYPNPFNATTRIEYSICRTGKVTLAIYNSLGQEIAKLVEQIQSSGYYQAFWDAGRFPSGIYFYQLKLNDKILATRKMLLIK